DAFARKEVVPAHQRGALPQDGSRGRFRGASRQGEDARRAEADGRRAVHGIRPPRRSGVHGAARLSRRSERAPPRSRNEGSSASAGCVRPGGGGETEERRSRRAGLAGAVPVRKPPVGMATVLVHIALLAYAAAAGIYLAWLVRPREWLVPAGRALLCVGLFLHLSSFAAAISLSHGEGLPRAGFGSGAWKGGQLFSLLA